MNCNGNANTGQKAAAEGQLKQALQEQCYKNSARTYLETMLFPQQLVVF